MKFNDLYVSQLANLKKRTYKEVYEKTVDENKNEISSFTTIESYFNREQNYIKVYPQAFILLDQIDSTLAPYLLAFGNYLTYANATPIAYSHTVPTDKITKDAVANLCNVSVKQVEKIISRLVAAEIFIPIEYEGKRLRGRYFVNPWIISRGEWKDVRQLQKSFHSKRKYKEAITIIDGDNRDTHIHESSVYY